MSFDKSLPIRLLHLFCHPDLLEDIEGDLHELYEERRTLKGENMAKRQLWLEVIKLFRPGIIRNFFGTYASDTIGMYRNYFKVSWRNLAKNKVFSAINITSLSIGITACLIIFLFIKDELSFDAFHSKKDRIYRLCELQTWEGTNPQNVPISWPKMGFVLPDYFPEVEACARYMNRGEELMEAGDKKLVVKSVAGVDSTFLQVFDFELISGNRKTALVAPNSIVISEDVATRFFSTTDVIGKSLYSDGNEFNITGVMENVPENSHLQFDMLYSLSTLGADRPNFNNETGSNFMIAYVLLKPNSAVDAIEGKFPDYLASLVDNPEINEAYKLFLQPLGDVHLASIEIEHDYQNYRKFNGTYIKVFMLTGIFILIIACVNFMNLTTARSNTRFREIGVRKSIGARKAQLVHQFILESVELAVIALIMGISLGFLALPLLNDLISRQLSMFTIFTDIELTGWIFGITILLGILSGLYPSLYLSSFRPTYILKVVGASRSKSILRSTLVIIQFSLAIGMIVSTIIVVQQLFFIQNKDVGFNKDHMLLVSMNDEANDKYELMKEELQRNPNVLGVTASGQRIGNNFHQYGFKYKKDTSILRIVPSNVMVDYNYLDVYGIKVKSGRNFSDEIAADDGRSFIINESFATKLDFDNPVGQRIGHGWYDDDSLGTIIGVTEDFNFNSLHYKVNALSMVVHSDWNFSEMSVKLNGNNLQAGINAVEKIWDEQIVDSGYPFEYKFLDEHFDEVYKSDQQMGSVVTIMAILSIMVGCLGLFGLASISIEQRIKEIGIRKALGATTGELLILLSKNYAVLIVISLLIASPLAYLYLENWLTNFAFHISINPLIFLLGGFIAMLVAIMTVSFHTFRASRTNPVDALHYE
ncbi:MAG: ABC transporter permease [Bacteroidota bacterium]